MPSSAKPANLHSAIKAVESEASALFGVIVEYPGTKFFLEIQQPATSLMHMSKLLRELREMLRSLVRAAGEYPYPVLM